MSTLEDRWLESGLGDFFWFAEIHDQAEAIQKLLLSDRRETARVQELLREYAVRMARGAAYETYKRIVPVAPLAGARVWKGEASSYQVDAGFQMPPIPDVPMAWLCHGDNAVSEAVGHGCTDVLVYSDHEYHVEPGLVLLRSEADNEPDHSSLFQAIRNLSLRWKAVNPPGLLDPNEVLLDLLASSLKVQSLHIATKLPGALVVHVGFR